jgi:trk system potassium uptake protein TrkH
MSYCNAGFGLESDSLASFPRGWPVVVMGVETILGGIGFLVIYNLCTFKFIHRISGARGRLSLHTRVVLRFTVYLLAITFLAFLAVEWNLSLKDMSLTDRAVVGFYQAVTPRTCGFCVIPTESLHPLTRLIYECLMFIGGAPGSAAAGMKVTTLAVILYTATAMCRGETETVMDRRLIPTEIVRESLVILMAIVMFAVIVTGALFVTEAQSGISSDALFFEAVSAVTTTGLSVGDTTASLSSAGRVVIMVAMFIGRLGALTVVLMIGDRESKRHVRFPSEELVVG